MTVNASIEKIDPWWEKKLDTYGDPIKLKKAHEKKPEALFLRISILFDCISQASKYKIDPKKVEKFITTLQDIPVFEKAALPFYEEACKAKDLSNARLFSRAANKLSREHYAIALRELPQMLAHLPIDKSVIGNSFLGVFARLCELGKVEKVSEFVQKHPEITTFSYFVPSISLLFKRGEKEASEEKAFEFIKKYPPDKGSYPYLLDRAAEIGNMRLFLFAQPEALITSSTILKAAEGGNLEIFKFMIVKLMFENTSLAEKSQVLLLALIRACSKGNSEIASLLLSDITRVDWGSLPPSTKGIILISALEGKSPEICHRVLQLIDSLRQEEQMLVLNWPRILDRITPLELASQIDDEAVLLSIFEKLKKIGGIQSTQRALSQTVTRCIEKNFYEATQKIYSFLQPQSEKDKKAIRLYFTNKLLSCLEKGQEKMACQLVKMGSVELFLPCTGGTTPLHLAAYKGAWEFLSFVNESLPPALASDLAYFRNQTGDNLIAAACRGGQKEVVEALIQNYGIALNFSTPSEETFFHLAAQSGINALLKALENDKKTIDKTIDSLGGPLQTTPIVYALINQHWESAHLLLNCGASLPSLSTPAISEAVKALKGCKDALLLDKIFENLCQEIETSGEAIPLELDFSWLANREKGGFQKVRIKDLQGKEKLIAVHPTLLKRYPQFLELVSTTLRQEATNSIPHLEVENLEEFNLLMNLLYGGTEYSIRYEEFKTVSKLISRYRLKEFDGYLAKWLEKKPECIHWKRFLTNPMVP